MILFFFFQVATYAKGLARRAILTEGSAKAAKSYEAKVASLSYMAPWLLGLFELLCSTN